MTSKYSRRKFIEKSALAGGSIIVASQFFPKFAFAGQHSAGTNIVAVKGKDYFASTQKCIESLGGMEQFVPKGARVGILVNAPPWWKHPGTYTNTDVVLSTAKMCLDAGAKELVYLIGLAPDFWNRSDLSTQHQQVIDQFTIHSGEYPEWKIEKGISLKSGNIIKDLNECDVFINLPVIKNHGGVKMTGCLKNMMGCCTGETNKYFHNGPETEGDSEDVGFLSQCIADLNLVRQPDLNIADASQVLLNNGPFGPGELEIRDTVIAGTDSVAVDAYSCRFLDLDPEEVDMIVKAHQHGLGQMDLSKVTLKELTI